MTFFAIFLETKHVIYSICIFWTISVSKGGVWLKNESLSLLKHRCRDWVWILFLYFYNPVFSVNRTTNSHYLATDGIAKNIPLPMWEVLYKTEHLLAPLRPNSRGSVDCSLVQIKLFISPFYKEILLICRMKLTRLLYRVESQETPTFMSSRSTNTIKMFTHEWNSKINK